MLKRALYLVLAGVLVTTFSSCTHEYICQCKISFKGAPGLPEDQVNEYTIEDTKKNAAKLCEEASSNYTDANSGITTTETCKLF